jgi:signal transduction histidine kinase
MTRVALDTDLTDQQREHLRLVELSAESMLAVLNEILDFAKIEAHKLSLDPDNFDLRPALDGALRVLAARARAKGLAFSLEIEPDVPDFLFGDALRLRQVLVNLVGNAVKFTERGEIAVRVRLQETTAEWARLHFAVRDTGVGVPPEKHVAIFQPFVQADGSTTRKYGGTGLGLAIASQLVGMMGGRIWVESEVGRGSTFHFTAVFGRGEAG